MAAATRRPRRLAAAWIALLALASVVDPSGLFAAGGSSTVGPGVGLGVDTWFHLAGYAVLAWLLDGAVEGRGRGRRRALLAVTLAAAVGLGIEFVQAPIPVRTASAADAAANAVGAVVGVAARRAWRATTGAGRPGE